MHYTQLNALHPAPATYSPSGVLKVKHLPSLSGSEKSASRGRLALNVCPVGPLWHAH